MGREILKKTIAEIGIYRPGQEFKGKQSIKSNTQQAPMQTRKTRM